MTSVPKRIGVYYSHGQNFLQVLEAVRATYPHAIIDAFVPANYEVSTAEKAVADAITTADRTSYSLINALAILRLVRTIRARQCDLFIVLFRTNQLCVFAAMSGAKVCQCWGVDSRIHELEASPARAILGVLSRALTGWKQYLGLWWRARITKLTHR